MKYAIYTESGFVYGIFSTILNAESWAKMNLRSKSWHVIQYIEVNK